MVLAQSNERDLQSFPNTGANTATVPIHHTSVDPSSAFTSSLPDQNMAMRMPTCSTPAAIELGWFLAVRKETFRVETLYACLAAITVCVALLPLTLTGTASFGAAREECYVKTVVRLKGLYLNIDSPKYDPNWREEDKATNHLFPTHSFNSMSTVVSLFGFGVWLFFSPHNSDAAQDLDRTCTYSQFLPSVQSCC